VFAYGPGDPAWVAIDGDWDWDGNDTPGLYDPATGAFFLKNANAPGPADLVFTFGPLSVGWTPLAGDWNGDGHDSIGRYDPMTGTRLSANSRRRFMLVI
jgi:hypothetical protein